jgi:hypothetical protein
MTNIADFHKALKKLRKKIRSNSDDIEHSEGICYNVELIMKSIDDDESIVESWVQMYAIGWKFHSGNNKFPINGSYQSYQNDPLPWKGLYRELRMDLLDYLIEVTR